MLCCNSSVEMQQIAICKNQVNIDRNEACKSSLVYLQYC